MKKKETQSFVIRLQGLDKNRTARIYKTLNNLSGSAVEALKDRDMKRFTTFTDKMRPLMSYITTNKVKLSDHFDQGSSEILNERKLFNESLLDVSRSLKHNLKIIESAVNSISSVPFSPVIFSSEEVTNAYLDYFFPLSWDFEFDAVILVHLDDPRFLDIISARGQKRVFILGGGLTKVILDEKLGSKGITYWYYHDLSEIRELIRSITGRPPQKIICIDCGQDRLDQDTVGKLEAEANLGRTACWQRFNTVNRDDASGILNNLYRLATLRQTSEFHGRFEGVPAVVVCPGPSLQKNIETLRKLKGKAIIICVLHALAYLQEKKIEPDIVIQVDPKNLREDYLEKDGKKSTVWDEWIGKTDFTKVKYFITSAYSPPNLFTVPAQNIFWMNAGLPLEKEVPIDIVDYKRVGGSVAHSAFDILVEFGCSSIALVGQDLAYGKDGQAYSKGKAVGLGRKKDDLFMKNNYGADVEVKGYYGEPVITSEVFFSFANLFSIFADQLHSQKNIKLYNCTEGGMFIEGFEHCALSHFLKQEGSDVVEERIEKIFSDHQRDIRKTKERVSKINKFVGKNINLTSEVKSLLRKIKLFFQIEVKDDGQINKFNRLQNKIIKLMGRNYFYSLALQKNIHILQAGLRADPSVEGQLGYHKDFLEEVEVINERFKECLLAQKALLSKAL